MTKIYIKTFGCSLNQSESETMSGLLENAGFNVVSEYSGEFKDSRIIPENVDIAIINSCTVKNLSESKFFKELRFWNNKNVKVVATGCIPQAEPSMLSKELKNISVVGTREIVHIVDVVNKLIDGVIVHDLSVNFNGINDINRCHELPKVRRNDVIEIIPISEGCMNYCTYCKTKLARGELVSYPKENIISQFRRALSDGCKEFWITSQDNGCYGFDIYRDEKYFLPQLLRDLLSIDGDFRIRLGMCNPNNVYIIKNELVEVFTHPKMFKFLHIPVQSGSNSVLNDMKRGYTIEKFVDILKSFREVVPNINISTDIIVGFPGESDEDFEKTLSLMRNVRFDVINLSRFWLRKGTEAERMKQLPSNTIKKRSLIAKALFEELSLSKNSEFSGSKFTVLIDEYGKNDALIGRTDYYKQVVIRISDFIHNSDNPDACSKDIFMGKFYDVKIIGTSKFYLIGEFVQ
ncbi:MAG: tRNA (N(6)-L-threonylcarbamoyladenosine(37)-C(2))-methylthiotransferase [Candidatus Woesearchaeota archaeon]